MSPGCLFSSGPHPCEPCVWHFSGLGSHHLPFAASRQNPSCGTCGGGMSPVCCGVVKAEMPKGHLSPGSWQWLPDRPFGGCLGRTPVAAVTSATAWFAIQDSSGLPGGKPKAHLFVGVQHRRRDECLFQASSTSAACVVVRDYYVVQVGEVIPPRISTEGVEGELYHLVPQVDLQPPQACGSVELSK